MKKFIAKNPKLSEFIGAMTVIFVAEAINLVIILFVLNGEFFARYVFPFHVNPFSILMFFWAWVFVVVAKIWFSVFDLDTKEKRYDFLVGTGAIIGFYFIVLSSVHFV